MNPASPELNFSLPELEESGLLDCDFACESANGALPDDQTWAAAQLEPDDAVTAIADNVTGPQQLKQLQADLSNFSAQQSRPHNLKAVQEKRYNSREYQKRFRERQKVVALLTTLSLEKTVTCVVLPQLWYEIKSV